MRTASLPNFRSLRQRQVPKANWNPKLIVAAGAGASAVCSSWNILRRSLKPRREGFQEKPFE
jgi:hypothetical protein